MESAADVENCGNNVDLKIEFNVDVKRPPQVVAAPAADVPAADEVETTENINLAETTEVNGEAWSSWKTRALEDDFKTTTEFTDLSTKDQATLTALINAHKD
jgi:hypothetical protein